MMFKLLSQQSAPDADIVMFDDNPPEFNYFKLITEMLGGRVAEPQGRLTCLSKCIKGKAKELVKHCIQQPK